MRPSFNSYMSKPDVKVTRLDDKVFRGGLKEADRDVRNWVKDNKIVGKYFVNKDTGWDIAITANGIDKVLSGKRAAIFNHVKAIRAIPELIENAVLGETRPDRNNDPNIKNIHIFYAPLEVGKHLYRVKMTVKETNDGKLFYDHNLTEIEKPATSYLAHMDDTISGSAPHMGQRASTISVTYLLKDVKTSDGKNIGETAAEPSTKEASPYTSSPTVSVVTLGCPKNQADSQSLERLFAAEGFLYTETPEDSDVILVNTCGFIEDARRESINEILELAALKANGKKLLVFGCLAQRYKDELVKEIPEIDAIFGVGQESAIVAYCKEVKTTAAVPRAGTHQQISPPSPPYAYLKIADGCNRGCRFCAIPSIRGRFKSTAADRVIEEARTHLNENKKELILVAQDAASYGMDTGESLVALIDALASLDGDFWIRLMYLYPTSVDDALIDCIKRNDKVLKYLDIPIQHSEDGILRAMGRAGSRGYYLGLFDTIRSQLPGVCLRTTLMAGFPGESARDFRRLLSFVEEVKFDRLGVFAYSDEQGTAAFEMPKKVSKKTTLKRVEEIMFLQAEISYEKNRALIGRQFRGIVDDVQEGVALARLYCHAPEIDGCVFIEDTPGDFNTGDFVTIQITDAEEYDLRGEIIF